MGNRRKMLILCVLLAAASAVSAAPGDGLPTNLAAYLEGQSGGESSWHPFTVRQYNMRRVLNSELAAAERVASLELVMHLAGDDEAVTDQLGSLVAEDKTPEPLREAALDALRRSDSPKAAQYIARAAEGTATPPEPSEPTEPSEPPGPAEPVEPPEPAPEAPDLARTVRLWASVPADGPDEDRWRSIVERMSGKRWDRALIDGINAEQFGARGSALEVLAARMERPLLRRRILAVPPDSPAMGALQEFLRRFDYVPADGGEFLSTTWIYTNRSDLLDDAAALADAWSRSGDYEFNIRDFHLLSRLARDPLRAGTDRVDLVVEINRLLILRDHPRVAAYAGRPAATRLRTLADAVDRLSLADLWTIRLAAEMLARTRVQRALRIVARQDRADTTAAKGGLVVYESGQAEAKLYPADRDSENDRRYVPSKYAEKAARDAMCWFHAHFRRADSSDRLGPDAEELAAAREGNYRAIVLTSVSEDAFAAHYYDYSGMILSLGVYPLKR